MPNRRQSGERISFEFSEAGSLQDGQHHCEEVLDTLLGAKGLVGFKFGTTSDPDASWSCCTPTYDAMYVLYETQSAALVDQMEQHLVAFHHNWRSSTPRMDNDPYLVRAGGRGPRGPRYFAYVVVR